MRLTIRPFVVADVLRKRPNLKWGKDRGKKTAPACRQARHVPLEGEVRDNDWHLSLEDKRATRSPRCTNRRATASRQPVRKKGLPEQDAIRDNRIYETTMSPENKPKVKYARPPIQEAVCEVHFASGSSVSPEEFEKIKTVWQKGYPNQQVVTEKTVEFLFSVDKVDTQSRNVGHKLIARSKDGKDLAQLGPKFLAVNRVSPYLGWEESFRATIMSRAQEVVAHYGFDRLERVGLRYINKIELPEQRVRWADWFTIALPVPCGLGEVGGSFQFHFEQALSPGTQGIINFLTLPPQPEAGTTVILDIDVIWRGNQPDNELGQILDAVHNPHHDLFESYLLDKSRELFQVLP